MREPPEPRLLDADDEARRLGTTIAHLENMRRRHGLPFVKLGGKVRFDPELTDEWLKGRRRQMAES